MTTKQVRAFQLIDRAIQEAEELLRTVRMYAASNQKLHEKVSEMKLERRKMLEDIRALAENRSTLTMRMSGVLRYVNNELKKLEKEGGG